MNSIKLNAVAMTPTKATIGIGSTAWKKNQINYVGIYVFMFVN